METFHSDLVLKSWKVLVKFCVTQHFMFHQMFDRPFQRCHAKLPFFVLFIKTKILLHESIYRTKFS